MAALLDEEVESFHDSRVDEMMIIEIVYGHGRKGQISVKFGDDPKALEGMFQAKQAELSSEMEEKFKSDLEVNDQS